MPRGAPIDLPDSGPTATGRGGIDPHLSLLNPWRRFLVPLMEWYYSEGRTPVGPVGDQEFRVLVQSGRILSQTLVWRDGMPEWRAYGRVASEDHRSEAPRDGFPCAECGRVLPSEELIPFESFYICETCKPVFVQKLKEGIRLPGQMRFGGFWIRAGAKLIDGMIMGVVQMVAYVVAGFLAMGSDVEIMASIATLVAWGVQMVAAAGYNIYLVGKYGATIGKMACNLKVVCSDDGPVSYGRATGRYFAELLSMMIFYIGYIMAAFDDEKRTLHDRICDTRVIRK